VGDAAVGVALAVPRGKLQRGVGRASNEVEKCGRAVRNGGRHEVSLSLWDRPGRRVLEPARRGNRCPAWRCLEDGQPNANRVARLSHVSFKARGT